MKSLFLENEFLYDGSQLRSLFAYLDYKIQGDSVVSWIGPCNVTLEHMVDGEDLLAGEKIAGDKMVHFVIEVFNMSLVGAVALQRLFAAICLGLLEDQLALKSFGRTQELKLRREGDDIYFGDGKMSISIATVSPVSSLIHFAINIVNDGTPVKTASLNDVSYEPRLFAKNAMAKLSEEYVSILNATTKVRWVK
jgi:hypothetical protein